MKKNKKKGLTNRFTCGIIITERKERGNKNDKERNQRKNRQIRRLEVLPQHERPLDYRGLQDNK